jgi:hypothetical protein
MRARMSEEAKQIKKRTQTREPGKSVGTHVGTGSRSGTGNASAQSLFQYVCSASVLLLSSSFNTDLAAANRQTRSHVLQILTLLGICSVVCIAMDPHPYWILD